MADQTKTIKVDVKNNFSKTAADGKKMNKVVFDTKSAINDVLKSGKSYENQLKDVNKIVKETPLNVRDMNKQIQAYQSIALSAGRETPVGKEALKKAADLRDRYIDIQNETKRLADDQKNLQGVMQLASTGVAGFGAVQSSMALMGGESEALRETMTKLMAAQTLLNSINQIATALEKESSAMLLLKSIRTKALTAAQGIYTAVTGKATQATKLFKLALASTGIGLIVVAVGLLIANFDKLLKPMKAAIQGLKNFGDAIGLTNFKEKDLAKAREDRAVKNAERLQKEIDNLEKIRENLDKNYQAYKKQLDAEVVALEQSKEGITNKKKLADIDSQIREKNIAGIKEEYDTFKEGQQLKLKEYEKEIAKNQARINAAKARGSSAYKTELFYVKKYTAEANKLRGELSTNSFTQHQEYLNKLEALDIEQTKKEKANQANRNSNYKNYLQNRLNARRKIEDLENGLMTEGLEKDLEINKDKFRRLIEDTKKNQNLIGEEKQKIIDLYASQEIQSAKLINLKYEKIAKDKADKEKAAQDKANEAKDKADAKALQDLIAKQTALDSLEISLMKDKHLQEVLLLTQQYDAKFLLAKDNADLELQLEKQLAEDIEAIDEKHRKIQEDKDEDELEGKIGRAMAIAQVTADGLQLISGFADKFAGDDLERQKKAFKIKKVADIAQAGIDATKASLSAYAGTPGGPVVKGIAAGVAGGFGLLQIAKIKSAKFDSPSGGGGVSSAPQGAITSSGGPNVNIVGENGINQLEALQGQANGVTKAYVVSDEVTTAQALDRKIEDFATL